MNNELEEELELKNKEIYELKAEIQRMKDMSEIKGKLAEREDVSFYSLSFTRVSLRGGNENSNEIVRLNGLGDRITKSYKQVQELLLKNKKIFERGYIWIESEVFIENERLKDMYSNIKDKAFLEKLALTKNRDEFEKDFLLLLKAQKQTIVDLVVEQYDKGKHDMNIVNVINNFLSTKDSPINILEDHDKFLEITGKGKPDEK